MQTQSQPTQSGVAGNIRKSVPGGGQLKSSSAPGPKKSFKPLSADVDPKFVFARKGEKGEVDQARVAKLKSNPKRPAPLVRKSKNKLDAASKKKLIKSRKEAAQKFKERSEATRKDLVYRKNALARELKRKDRKAEVTKPTSPKLTNCSLIYQVGKAPKYKRMRKHFREFRKFRKVELQFSPEQQKLVNYIFLVGGKKGSTE